MKKFLVILLSLLVVGYLIFSYFYFGDTSKNQVCNRFEVVIKDSQEIRFLQPKDIENLIKNFKLHPVGKKVREINTLAIKDSILTNKLVKSAEVYTTRNGNVIANIYQREPVLRIISENQGNYYIDSNRERMPISSNFSVYVPLATGIIDEEFAKTKLYDFADCRKASVPRMLMRGRAISRGAPSISCSTAHTEEKSSSFMCCSPCR